MSGARLQLGPELTIYTAAATRLALLEALAAAPALVLDLGQVAEIDSAGIQLLLAAQRHSGCALTLEQHTGAVADVLALLGLDEQLAPLASL